MGWDGMGWDGMGWDGIGWMTTAVPSISPLSYYQIPSIPSPLAKSPPPPPTLCNLDVRTRHHEGESMNCRNLSMIHHHMIPSIFAAFAAFAAFDPFICLI
jgi:hypothetical protein